MKYRTLGTHDGGLAVSAIGIGCMPMIRDGNINYGAADDGESIRTIHAAIDLGVIFFDTAEMYGPFSNEELVGAAIRGGREGLACDAGRFGGCARPDAHRRRPGRARCSGAARWHRGPALW